MGPAKALFMDEISSGLDSSTTYQIVKCLRQSVHVLDGTMLVSLLQPAPETYALFDDLILLSEGQIVYQGPCDLVVDFFETMGFKCPRRKGIADFLQEVGSTNLISLNKCPTSKHLVHKFLLLSHQKNSPFSILNALSAHEITVWLQNHWILCSMSVGFKRI